jgi:group I intron endonuclease
MEYIYKITNETTGRVYIGATCSFVKRKQDHISSLRNGKHKNILIQRDFNKYGKDSFLFEVILEQEDCFSVEQEYINKYGTYNVAKGGIGGDIFNQLPTDHQDKIRKMSSDRNKKRYANPDERRKCNVFPEWLSEEDKQHRLKIWSECKKGPSNGRFKHDKKVLQINSLTGETIKVWPYARMLQDYGYSPKYVIYCCQHKAGYATHRGFIWRWNE